MAAHGFLEEGDCFRRLVECGLHHLEHVIAEGGIDRAFELFGLGLQLLVLHRFLVGLAQCGEAIGRNVGRASGQACDIALALHQRDQGLGGWVGDLRGKLRQILLAAADLDNETAVAVLDELFP